MPNGSFTIPGLPIGPYRLEVSLHGFRSYAQTDIVLQVGSAPNIPVALALGAVAENVTVTGESPLIDTGKLGIGQVMDNKRIMDLPLNGRNAGRSDPVAARRSSRSRRCNATSRAWAACRGAWPSRWPAACAFGVAYIARRRDAQQPVRQPEPAAAVSRTRCRSSGRKPAR